MFPGLVLIMMLLALAVLACLRLTVQMASGEREPGTWSPPPVLRSLGEVVSPAVPFANHAPHQYTAETAGT